MNREQFIQYISDEYGVDEEYLFAKHPLFCVFRHSNNRKWFAVVMDVPKNKLGLKGADALDVVNLKCDPILIGSLRKEPGIFPAYHMSKANWVSVALDGSVPDEQIKKSTLFRIFALSPAAYRLKIACWEVSQTL